MLKELLKSYEKMSDKTRVAVLESIFMSEDKSLLNTYLKKKTLKTLGPKTKREKEDTKPTKVSGLGELEKNSSLIPGIAKNIALLRENILKLVALKTKSDFFAQQDAAESALEASRLKPNDTMPTVAGQTTESTSTGGGFLDNIMSFFKTSFLEGIKSFAKSGKILKLVGQALKKVFLPLAIIGTLWSGITAGFKRYQETGSFSEAIFAGLGGSLEFLTFGLFGEDSLRKVWTALQDFMTPITKTISNIFKTVKDWFIEKFGSFFGIKPDEGGSKDMEPPKPDMPDVSKYVQKESKSGTQDGVGGVIKESKSGIQDGVSGVLKESKSGTQDGVGGVIKEPKSGTQDGVGGVIKEPKSGIKEPKSGIKEPKSGIQDGVSGVIKQYEESKSKKEIQNGVGSVYREATTNKRMQKGTGSVSKETTTDKVKQLSNKKESLDSELKQATETFKQQKEERKSLVDSGAMSPEEAKKLDDQSQSTLDGMKIKIDAAKAEIDATISSLEASGDSKSPSVSVGGPSAPASGVSSGGGGGGSSIGSTGASAAGGAGPSVSGSDISSASSSVAEAQRMESAADLGSIINAPKAINTAGQVGQEPDTVPEVYDESLTELLTT